MRRKTLIAVALAAVAILAVLLSLLLIPQDQEDIQESSTKLEQNPPIVTEIPKDDLEVTSEVTTTATDVTTDAVTLPTAPSSTTQNKEESKPTTMPVVDSSESSQVTKPKPTFEETETTASIVGEESFIMTDEIIVGDKEVDVILPDLPQYIEPEINNDNPFDDGNNTQIIDVPVDNYIPDNGDRPGEGIHF